MRRPPAEEHASIANIALESSSATSRPADEDLREAGLSTFQKVTSCVEEEGREGVIHQTLETGRILSSIRELLGKLSGAAKLGTKCTQ